MIEIDNKEGCCGCSICAGACPKECIEMKEDEEGFVYPHVNETSCVNCHLCERVCPVITASEERDNGLQEGYIVQHKDPKILRESTAGGAFTAIAKYVLDRKGVVFGAELQDDLFTHPSAVRHIWTERIQDLEKFRNSKYVQSFIGVDVVHRVKSCLEQDRYVCFSGTPCQVEGLKQYLDVLKVEQSKLILVDVVCHAVPSPMIFRKYIEHYERKEGTHVTSARFRDKHYGYKYSTMNISSDKLSKDYYRGAESDPWLRAFLSNICDRPSCYKCQFKKQYRVSDFTIWDCFHVGRFSKELDNDKGATRVLIHSKKGEELFNGIMHDLNSVPVDVGSLVEGSKEMFESVSPNKHRSEFFADAVVMDGHALFEKYFPETVKVRLERMVRLAAFRLGIYDAAKKAYVRLTGKY